MRATNLLTEEHREILEGLSLLRSLADSVATDEPVRNEAAANLLEFLVRVADGTHRDKEESVLFPALVKIGFDPNGGPLGVLTREHDRAHGLLDRMRSVLGELGQSRSARGQFVTAARSYGDLLENHIAREDSVLFPMVDKVLGPEDDARLLAGFAECDARLGPDLAGRLRTQVGTLRRAYVA